MMAFNEGHHAEALQEFRLCLDSAHGSTDPVHSLALFYAAESAFLLGGEALESGDLQQAIQYFEAARVWNPHFPELQFHFALASAALGRTEASLAAIACALLLDPEHVGAHALQAVLWRESGHEDAASGLDWLRRQADSHPVSDWVHAFFQQRDPLVAALLRPEAADQPTAPPAPGMAPAHGDP